MAIVRVLTATGYLSDDLFGPVEFGPNSLSGNPDLIYGFPTAYGTASTTSLVFDVTPDAQSSAYSGAVAGITARNAGDTVLASVTFPVPFALELNGASVFTHEGLFRAFDPSLPSLRFSSADDMEGNAGNDTFFGYGADDDLRGMGGNDRLIGGSGNDTLSGGAGGDMLVGGLGNDIFRFDSTDSTTTDRIYGGEGSGVLLPGEINTVSVTGTVDFSFASFDKIQRIAFGADGSNMIVSAFLLGITLPPNLQLDGANGNQTFTVNLPVAIPVNLSAYTFTNWDAALDRIVINGSFSLDILIGTSQGDTINGAGAYDTLNGGGGADILDGGTGGDTYQLGADITDTLVDVSGTDTVTSTITRNLGTWAFIENLILEGAAHINGTGNAAGNSIVGNGGNNILAGLDGNDVLVGSSGNDQLFGQANKDSLMGGANNDRFVFQSTAHTAAGLGDVIVDLDDNGDDVIDLTGIIPGIFIFIGQVAFAAANQVRYQQVGANVLVQINTTGPNGAEGEITLVNTTIGNGAIGQVNAADFLL